MSKYQNMTTEKLAEELSREDLSQEEKKEIAIEMIKNVGLKTASQTLLTTTRYIEMKERLKAVVEEDGEVYMVEIRKIADTTPEKGVRSAEREIKNLTITIEEYN